MIFVFNVTLQDHIMKLLNDFVDGVCHHLTEFGDQRHCGSGDKLVSVCHVISQEFVIKRVI